MSIPIEVRNVNGVRDLSFSFEEPGVYALRGRNGAGKSSTMHAIRAAAGDRDAVAEPTDGTKAGTVRVGGVTMIVGQRRLANGLPSVELATDRAISDLIDPGIKDEKAANRRRIDALLSLVHLPADEAALVELTRHDAALFPYRVETFPDALALAREIKRDADRRALENEKAAEDKGAEARVLQEQLLAMPARQVVLDVREAEAAARAARDRCTEVKARMMEQTRADERIAQIKASMGEEPQDPLTWASEIESLKDQAYDLRKKLAEIEAREERLRAEQTAAARARAKWDEQQAALAAVATGPRVSEPDVLGAEDAASRALDAVAAARQAQERNALMDRTSEAIRYVDKVREQAERFRKVAAGIPFALGRLLKRAGVPGLTIGDDDMLCVERDDGARVPFATRLSFGQRVAVALDIALHSYRARGAGSVPCTLALDPELWLALDAEHRAIVAQQAKDRGVFVLVEEPAEGDLRVERVTS